MKTLNDLKEGRVIPFARYAHNGREAKYFPETAKHFAHYKIYDGRGEPRSVTTKKQAIKLLES